MQFQIRFSTIYYIFHEHLLIQTLMKYPVSSHLSNIRVKYAIKNVIIFNSTFSFHYHVELINIKLIFYGGADAQCSLQCLFMIVLILSELF